MTSSNNNNNMDPMTCTLSNAPPFVPLTSSSHVTVPGLSRPIPLPPKRSRSRSRSPRRKRPSPSSSRSRSRSRSPPPPRHRSSTRWGPPRGRSARSKSPSTPKKDTTHVVTMIRIPTWVKAFDFGEACAQVKKRVSDIHATRLEDSNTFIRIAGPLGSVLDAIFEFTREFNRCATNEDDGRWHVSLAIPRHAVPKGTEVDECPELKTTHVIIKVVDRLPSTVHQRLMWLIRHTQGAAPTPQEMPKGEAAAAAIKNEKETAVVSVPALPLKTVSQELTLREQQIPVVTAIWPTIQKMVHGDCRLHWLGYSFASIQMQRVRVEAANADELQRIVMAIEKS